MPRGRPRHPRPPTFRIEPVSLAPVEDHFVIRTITDADALAISYASGYVTWNRMHPCDEQLALEQIQRWRSMQHIFITVEGLRVVVGPPYMHLLIERKWPEPREAPIGLCAFDLIGEETIHGNTLRSAELWFQTDPAQYGVMDITEKALPLLLDFGFRDAAEKGLQLDQINIRIREGDLLIVEAVKEVMGLVFGDHGSQSWDQNQYIHTWVLQKSEWFRLRYNFFN